MQCYIVPSCLTNNSDAADTYMLSSCTITLKAAAPAGVTHTYITPANDRTYYMHFVRTVLYMHAALLDTPLAVSTCALPSTAPLLPPPICVSMPTPRC